MRIIPLGGAHEVGASSTIVEFGRHRILVDAGIRIGASDGEQLPDLSRIQEEAGELDAIFLTHAHMDHSGALPLVHMAYPNVPIYMTPATAAVVRILLSDSLRLMEGRYEQEGEIPLYPPEAVASCLGCVRPVSFDYPLQISQGEIAAAFHPAGHILGASSISLTGNTGSILLSGDISVTEQRTIPGMLAPPIRPDVVMVESTYGNRLHAHRPTQEAELVRTVGEIVESGGKVIFPAFAVGRAQEIILILRHAMASGALPPFPIFVDGMVQTVCDAYSRFPTYLQQQLRHAVQKGENLFFPAEGHVHRVKNARQRQSVLEGPACCIIASSGMMTGGPSAYYASHLADDRKNLIAITGYQDEEAPGRRLLDLAEAPPERRTLRIQDRVIQVRCRVEKYALSAHADSGEISGLIGQMDPTQGVVLVHGDGEARGALATTLDAYVGCEVFTPGNGEKLEFRPSKRVFFKPPKQIRAPRIGGLEQALDRQALAHLHQTLWAESGRRVLYRIGDLYSRWYGPNAMPSPEEVEELEGWLEELPYFERDRKRPHLFRLRSPKKPKAPKKNEGIMEMNRAIQAINEIFPDPDESGLYKKGARHEERTLRLIFRFPKIAARRYHDEIEALAHLTGWRVELNDMPHHAALDAFARQLLPEDWSLLQSPSIIHDQELVLLRVLQPQLDATELHELLQQMNQDFIEHTGYRLELHFHKASKRNGRPDESPSPPVLKDPEGRLEINRAYQFIEQAFAPLPHQPYKKSKKGERIVLSFLSPRVGQRYQSFLEELAQEVGWPVEINPEPNQYGIKQEARAIFPRDWQVLGEPGVLRNHSVVRVRLSEMPKADDVEAVAEQIFERTGFHLEVSIGEA